MLIPPEIIPSARPLPPLVPSPRGNSSSQFMKSAFLLLVAIALPCAAQELQVLERGPHHQVLQRVKSFVDQSGATRYRTNRFTELADGLCYLPDGPNATWELSREEFQVFENGFVGNQGPLKVTLSADINRANAIDVVTEDGQHFEISPVFLALRDGTGQSVVVSEIQNAQGRLIAPNTVFYDGAFPGAGIRIILTRSGIEQDCVIFDEKEAQLNPADYGLIPETTTIELWSEFLTAPDSVVVPLFEGDVATDVEIDFGSTKIGAGKAFAADNQDVSVPVRKAFGMIDNRRFLVEKIEYPKAKPFLDNLDQAAAGKPRNNIPQIAKRKPVKSDQELVAQLTQKPRGKRTASTGKPKTSELMAMDWKARPAFVIDFMLGTTGSIANFTFKADSTYYISGTVTCSGSTVFESSVLKYTNSAQLRVTGPVDFRVSSGRPVIMTAIDDESIGETVRTNALTGKYATVALDLDGNSSGVDFLLKNLRISHAQNAIRILGRTGHTISHAQFVNCSNAITLTNASARVRNALLYNVGIGITGANTSTARCEQVTFNAGAILNGNTNGVQLLLTNSLITAVTTTSGYLGANVTVLSSAAGVYQTVGAGSHYLAAGSPYRTSGNATIDSQLAAELKKLTTYPPVVLSPSQLMATTVNYMRTVPRATAGNAIGYHYDPIDYAASGLYAVNGTIITIQPGVVFAGYRSAAGDNYIFGIDYGGKIRANGTEEQPCRFLWYNSVQEQANTAWQGDVGALVARGTFYASAPSTELSFRFTDWVVLGTDAYPHISGAEDSTASPTVIRDSSFHGGMLWLSGSKFNLTNCLMDRVATTVWLDASDANRKAYIRGSMLYGGTLGTYDGGTKLFSVRDSVFFQARLEQGSDVWDHGWNGYYTNGCTNCFVQASPAGLNVTNSISFLSGPLGTFYQPTSSPLINAGSTNNAALFGLYHYTTTTNQVKEANSTNDIGLHYLATSGLTSTAALDGDADGVPDAFEDIDGDNVLDAGETSVSSYNSKFGIGTPAPGLVVFTLMK
jgi:hypothetical protein